VSESSAGGVPGGVLGEKRAFEKPIPRERLKRIRAELAAKVDAATASKAGEA